jgi:hypothetical protein
MTDTFEEQYMGVLQNIEFALVTAYRQNPKLNDHAALRRRNARQGVRR